jgi:hypothetical protein
MPGHFTVNFGKVRDHFYSSYTNVRNKSKLNGSGQPWSSWDFWTRAERNNSGHHLEKLGNLKIFAYLLHFL